MNTGFDLEARTEQFARDCRDYFSKLNKTRANIEYTSQGIRSSGSTAANYIEANESLSKKDFYMRIKICKKEAKETRLWLNLSQPDETSDDIRDRLTQESTELIRIFSTILKSST